MGWISDGSGTKTPMLPTACTFSNGSATITVANTMAVDDHATLSTTGTLPTNFAPLPVNYWVVAATSTTVQLSLTRGGTAIVAGSAGSGTHTIYPEHTLAISTVNSTFNFEIDGSAMTYGDSADYWVYKQVLAGGLFVRKWHATGGNVDPCPVKGAPGEPSSVGILVSLRQMTGTARAFPWKLEHL